MRRLLSALVLAAALLGAFAGADKSRAQNITCPDRPASDNSYACANTRFVNSGLVPIVVGTTPITSGINNGLLYDNGGVLGNLATANSGVLVTSAGGVPSISSTLPSGLTIPSPTLTGTPVAPTASFGTSTTQVATTAFVQAALCTALGAVPAGTGSGTQCSTAANSEVIINGGPLVVGANVAPVAGPLLVVNANTAQIPSVGFSNVVTQFGGAINTLSRNLYVGAGNSTANGFHTINMIQSRGTLSSPTATQNNDIFGAIGGKGYGSTSYGPNSGSVVIFSAAETWTDTNQGSRIVFQTTPLGTGVAANTVWIQPSGAVSIGASTDLGIPGSLAMIGSSSALASGASTPTFMLIQQGSSGTPYTTTSPSIQISRVESFAAGACGGDGSGCAIMRIDGSTNNAQQLNGLKVSVTTNPSGTTTNDNVAGYFVATHSGNAGAGHVAYAIFADAGVTTTGNAGVAVGTAVINTSGSSSAYNPGTSNNYAALDAVAQYVSGAVTFYGAGVQIRASGGDQFDVGFAAQAGTIHTALIQDDSSSPTVLLVHGGSHTTGIDLTGGTYSGNQIVGTGFSINSNASVVTLSNIMTDGGHTDRTVCQDTTSKALFTGSGAAGICLGTSGQQFKNLVGLLGPVLERLVQIPVREYYYLHGYGDDGEHLQRGPTAQDVAKVFPDLVRYNGNGDAINYDWGALVFISVKAVQELKADNDNLRAELKLKRASNQ